MNWRIVICLSFGLALIFCFFLSRNAVAIRDKESGNPETLSNVSSASTNFVKLRETKEWLRRIFFPTPAERQRAALAAKYHREYAEKRKAEKKKKAEEAAYWESRQQWIENFPFEPTYHPTITFDPNIYNPVGPGGPSDDTPEGQKMAKMIENHGFLSSFYENPKRYSPEFEKLCHILKEEGVQPDPMLFGWLYTHLVDYHKASTKDLNAPWPGDPNITWDDKMHRTLESIAGRLQSNMGRILMVDSFPSTEKVDAIRNRLIDEIKADGFLNIGQFERFVYDGDAEYALKPGDPLLIQ